MDRFGIKIKSIVKSRDKYLILKRWYDDRILDPYQWEFADGDLTAGESPEQAAERIVREQTQMEVSGGKVLYTWAYPVGESNCVGICYLFEVDDSTVFLSEDLAEYCWESFENLSKYTMNESVINDIKKYLA